MCESHTHTIHTHTPLSQIHCLVQRSCSRKCDTVRDHTPYLATLYTDICTTLSTRVHPGTWAHDLLAHAHAPSRSHDHLILNPLDMQVEALLHSPRHLDEPVLIRASCNLSSRHAAFNEQLLNLAERRTVHRDATWSKAFSLSRRLLTLALLSKLGAPTLP